MADNFEDVYRLELLPGSSEMSCELPTKFGPQVNRSSPQDFEPSRGLFLKCQHKHLTFHDMCKPLKDRWLSGSKVQV